MINYPSDYTPQYNTIQFKFHLSILISISFLREQGWGESCMELGLDLVLIYKYNTHVEVIKITKVHSLAETYRNQIRTSQLGSPRSPTFSNSAG